MNILNLFKALNYNKPAGYYQHGPIPGTYNRLSQKGRRKRAKWGRK